MKLGVFIAGRLKSERLPRKLILPLGSRNLWDIACEKLDTLPQRYKRYALCCDKELIEIAQRYPSLKIIQRGSATTQKDGPLRFIFKDLQQVDNTHLMFLNPCLIFLRQSTIVQALQQFEEQNLEYATSVKKLQNWIFLKTGEALNPIDYVRLSTKEIEPLYQAAHCFHIFNKINFFKDGQMLKKGHAVILVPEGETIDVDTQSDFEYVKWQYENLLA
jgi:CMP-N-acetylneuraminic acid synthetase